MKWIGKVINKIKENKQKSILIAATILAVMIIAIIITVVIMDIKDRQVSTNIEEEEKQEINLKNDEELEYININELGNETSEENSVNEVNENSTKNNATTTTSSSSATTYYIKVNYGAQVTTIYKKDNEGNYTIPVKAMVCSTGISTPKSGVYKIPYKYRWLGLIGDVYGQYCTQVVGNILFHSVPYLKKGNAGSLEYWEYDKLGTYASAGCIRLTVADAMWIYNNCSKGTPVEFYSSSNPGPLGKPSVKKISNAEGDLRNWDPTDPDKNNPWHSQSSTKDEKNTVENKENTTTNTTTNTVTNKTNTMTNTTNTAGNKTNSITNTTNTTNTTENKTNRIGNTTSTVTNTTNTVDKKTNTTNTTEKKYQWD